MQLIGRNFSPFTRRVAISLRLLGIDFEQVGLSSADNRDQILQWNPLGRIPVLLLDGERPLIDSWAILDQLDQQVVESRRLLPSSGPERQQRLQSTVLAVGVIEKCVARFYETGRRAAQYQSPEVLALLDEQLGDGLAALERELRAPQSEGNWFINDHPSQADVSAFVAFQCATMVSPEVVAQRDLGRLRQHERRCSALPAFRDSPVG